MMMIAATIYSFNKFFSQLFDATTSKNRGDIHKHHVCNPLGLDRGISNSSPTFGQLCFYKSYVKSGESIAIEKTTHRIVRYENYVMENQIYSFVEVVSILTHTLSKIFPGAQYIILCVISDANPLRIKKTLRGPSRYHGIPHETA